MSTNTTTAEENAVTPASESKISQEQALKDWLAHEGPKGYFSLIYSWTRDLVEDPERLPDWSRWQEMYNQIESMDQAFGYSQQMLASLNDHVACVYRGATLNYEHGLDRGVFIGTGIVFSPDRTKERLLIKNDKAELMPVFDRKGFPVVTRVIPNSPAAKIGIEPGDIITAISRRSTVNKSIAWLVEQINGSIGASLTIRLYRNSKSRSVRVTQDETPLPVSWQRHGNAGYLRIESFADEQLEKRIGLVLDELSDCSGLVIDLRGTPGGLIAKTMEVTSLFLEAGVLLTSRYRIYQGSMTTDTITLSKDSIVTTRQDCSENPIVQSPRCLNKWGDKLLVVLIDSHTRSAPECMTMALRDHGRAIVIGEPSLGKGVRTHITPIESWQFDLPCGTWKSPSGFWIGDAGNTCHYGVIPDINVEATPGLVFGAGNDNQLASAYQWLEDHQAR